LRGKEPDKDPSRFKLNNVNKYFLLIILASMLGACLPAAPSPVLTETPTASPIPASTATRTPAPASLWISPAVPDALRQAAQRSEIPVVSDGSQATVRLDVDPTQSAIAGNQLLWTYALVAPFPTVTDGVTLDDIKSSWHGSSSGPFRGRPLWMAESTLAALTAIWGEPASGSVKTAPADQLVDLAWAEMPAWGIVPFEEIQPKWKVLTIDGQSPIRKNFDPANYPLKVDFGVTYSSEVNQVISIPASNRDPSKLTTVILTGVTALWAATSYIMEVKGITYPGSSIRDALREADITHISNEVPFDPGCSFPNPGETSLAILCSQPAYMELFNDVGMDIVELTGDHFDNRGVQAMLDTLELYKQNGTPYYGGGANRAESIKPLLLESNGNKFVFIGCNAKVEYPHATDIIPGAAPCDFEYMVEQIRTLRAQGYLPIVTFQDYEYYSPEARPGQIVRFHMMADAGAALVSGSQAHFPQVMEFYNGAFLHYGLGNLFYQQMTYTLEDGSVIDGTRNEFIDRHVFYDGRYLGVELLTAKLMDYSRPEWMTSRERLAFLSDYFYASGWIPFSPTPTPAPTMTLTPIALPGSLSTPTP
jgi:poly-gamma-glutamate synthesis protein (capsule biosynthesis protein)